MSTLTQRHRDITKLLQCKYAPCALQQINVPLCGARTKLGRERIVDVSTAQMPHANHRPARISGGESRFNRARLA
jgi:hypothetical protein